MKASIQMQYKANKQSIHGSGSMIFSNDKIQHHSLNTEEDALFHKSNKKSPAQAEPKQHELLSHTDSHNIWKPARNLSTLAARAVARRTATTKKGRRTSHNH